MLWRGNNRWRGCRKRKSSTREVIRLSARQICFNTFPPQRISIILRHSDTNSLRNEFFLSCDNASITWFKRYVDKPPCHYATESLYDSANTSLRHDVSKPQRQYATTLWATRSSVCSLARSAHSFAYFTLLHLRAPLRSLARSFRSLVGQCMIE